MKKLMQTGTDMADEYNNSALTDVEKQRIGRDISSALAALVCLVVGLIFKLIYPEQPAVSGLIFTVGIAIEIIPLFVTAIKGFMQKDIVNTMEILVSIAVFACYITGQHVLAITIPVILSIVHFLEERSIMGGRDAIEGLKQMQASTAILETKDGEKTIPAAEIKKGDIIIVRPGMSLPIDGTVIWGNSSIDQKSLTGEPLPVAVGEGDSVYAGTINIDGVLRIRADKEYDDASFQQIVHLLEEAQKISLPEMRVVDKFMHYYIPFVLVTAALTALLSKSVNNAIAVLVVSCPCGHMLVSSAPMIAALAASTKRGILIKNSKFVEQLTRIHTVVFDKTGTITKGELSVSSCTLQDAKDEDEIIQAAATVANSSLHPISRAVMAYLGDKGYESGYEIKEIPGKGVIGTHGEDVVLFGSRHWVEEQGYSLVDIIDEGGSVNWVVKNHKVLGCIQFNDTIRKEAAETITELKKLGLSRSAILTGDRKQSAETICKEAGIDLAYSQLLPTDKLDIVNKLQKEGCVLAVGDGINDALALAEADVGIAMGAMGSDIALKSADIALMNNDLKNISYVIALAHTTKSIMYQNIAIAFSVSLFMMLFSAFGLIPAIAGAFLHNIGAFIILFNSSRIIRESNIGRQVTVDRVINDIKTAKEDEKAEREEERAEREAVGSWRKAAKAERGETEADDYVPTTSYREARRAVRKAKKAKKAAEKAEKLAAKEKAEAEAKAKADAAVETDGKTEPATEEVKEDKPPKTKKKQIGDRL